LELDLKLDDLLEMQKDNQEDLDLEYVQFNEGLGTPEQAVCKEEGVVERPHIALEIFA
jgi:hypothetical protein